MVEAGCWTCHSAAEGEAGSLAHPECVAGDWCPGASDGCGSGRVEEKEAGLAKKGGGYKFEKRRKELKKQKKKREKLERRNKLPTEPEKDLPGETVPTIPVPD